MIMGFVGRLLSRPRLHSSSAELQLYLSTKELSQIALGLPDRRFIFAEAAQRLKLDEVTLVRKIAGKLRLPFIENPGVLDLSLLSSTSTEDLRAAGAIGLANGSQLVALICIDPCFCEHLPEFVGLPRYLSTWAKIASALDASELCLGGQKRQELHERDPEEGLVASVLAVIFDDSVAMGVESLEIDCRSNVPLYRFTTNDGRSGAATLNEALRGSLVQFLSRYHRSGDSTIIGSSGGGSRRVIVRGSLIQGVYRVSIASETGSKVPGSKKIVALQPEAPVATREPERAWCAVVSVVEDNDTFAKVLERFLLKLSIRCIHHPSSVVAVSEIVVQQPDLVVCDIHMPDVKGIDVVKALRRSSGDVGNVPVVVLTSDGDREVEIEALNAGADAVVLKGEDPRILCAHIQRLIAQHKRGGIAA